MSAEMTLTVLRMTKSGMVAATDQIQDLSTVVEFWRAGVLVGSVTCTGSHDPVVAKIRMPLDVVGLGAFGFRADEIVIGQEGHWTSDPLLLETVRRGDLQKLQAADPFAPVDRALVVHRFVLGWRDAESAVCTYGYGDENGRPRVRWDEPMVGLRTAGPGVTATYRIFEASVERVGLVEASVVEQHDLIRRDAVHAMMLRQSVDAIAANRHAVMVVPLLD